MDLETQPLHYFIFQDPRTQQAAEEYAKTGSSAALVRLKSLPQGPYYWSDAFGFTREKPTPL